jgi:hypothetical protein
MTNRKVRTATTCSLECDIALRNARKSEQRWQETWANRQPCAQCGGPIPETRTRGAKYCSRSCGAKAAADRFPKEKRSAYNRRYNYDLAPEEFEALLAGQGGVCAICKTDEWRGKHNKPHVDHDHATGRVRGILCGQCNNGLGNYRDNPDVLRAAADYLERAAVPS